MEKLILASNSPRRKELLGVLGVPFDVIVPGCDESYPADAEPLSVPAVLARRKAEAVSGCVSSESVVVAADTMVHFRGRLLGKPRDENEARGFISMLQGDVHDVVTGVAVAFGGRCDVVSVVTRVKIRSMDGSDIEWNLSRGEWKDAAGAYKIQGATACFVDWIEGSYSNVVGLPISTVYDMLKKQGFDFR